MDKYYTQEEAMAYAVATVDELMAGKSTTELPTALDALADERDWLVQNMGCCSKWEWETNAYIVKECVRRLRAMGVR